MDGADCSSFRRSRRCPAEECPGAGRRASANLSNSGFFLGGGRMRPAGSGRVPPPDTPSASRGDFRAIRRFGFAAAPRPPGPRRGGRQRRRARIPRILRQGRTAFSPAQGRRERVFPPARPNLAGSGESGADTPALRRGQNARCPPPYPKNVRCAWSPQSPVIPLRRWQSAISQHPSRFDLPHNTKASDRSCLSH